MIIGFLAGRMTLAASSSWSSAARSRNAVDALAEEGERIVERLALDVLGERQGRRPARRRVEHQRHRLGQRGQDLLGPDDPVEEGRHRLESIVGGDGEVVEMLDLLQHRIGKARREVVAAEEQHRQPVRERDAGGGDHVGRAGPDRGGADMDLLAAPRPRIGDRGERHRLLVLAAIGRELIAHLGKRRTEAGHIAVAEDCMHP
jgi:hypothetical protein